LKGANTLCIGLYQKMATQHTCDNCGESFSQKAHLTSHKKRKNPCVKESGMTMEKIQQLIEEQQQQQQHPCEVVKPPLKWVGGKTQILDELMKKVPRKIKNYYEPFLGGGSVLLAVLSNQKAKNMTIEGKIYASDVNQNIIALYKNIQSNLPTLLEQLATIVQVFEKCPASEGGNRTPATEQDALSSKESYYYWIRKCFNELSDPQGSSLCPAASAMLLFLNKTCFRGVYREGPHGFNVPYGHYKNPGIYEEAHLRQVSELIKDVEFHIIPFTQALPHSETGDFVYLDPPYAPSEKNSFVSYNASGFKEKDHKDLFQLCHRLRTNSIKFLLSNSDVDMVTKEFPEADYETQILSCKRSINSKDPSQRANEVLIRPLA
jgi:DNA adenine methylase